MVVLDEDPLVAATYLADRDLDPVLRDAISCLAGGWFAHHDPATTFDAYLELVVPPPSYGASKPTKWTKDGVVMTGGNGFWLLLGQRIGAAYFGTYAWRVWAADRPNYVWLWEYAHALVFELRHRNGRWPRAAPVVWTLEAIPPRAGRGSGKRAPFPPRVASESSDPVAGYRAHYLSQPRLEWTRRAKPDWWTGD